MSWGWCKKETQTVANRSLRWLTMAWISPQTRATVRNGKPSSAIVGEAKP